MASKRFSQALFPLIAFRWLSWTLTIGMLILRPGPLTGRPTLVAALVGSTMLYCIGWSARLSGMARRAERRPALLLADLIVSLLPAWVSGGWESPFLPFALGALMLPSVLFHWRGTLVASLVYVVLDQIVGWTSWRPGTRVPLASPSGYLNYLWPLLIAAFWPLTIELRRRIRRPAVTKIPAKPITALDRIAHDVVRRPEMRQPALRDESGATTLATWGSTRSRPQAVEQLPMVGLFASIQQVIAEAEERGLQVKMSVDGPEPELPQDRIHLLVKVVDVGLDNILRHAHTVEAEVRLTIRGDNLLLRVQDRGTGLLDGTAEPPGFHQLRRLRYRLQEIEGQLDVREDEAGGVILDARVPAL